MTKIRFFVPGKPATAGSKRAFINRKTGRPIITDACKRSREWKDTVATFAIAAMQTDGGREMFARGVPLAVSFYFAFLRPKSHFGTGRNANKLKPSAPRLLAIRPDALKLARAVEDALTGILWHDDAQIVREHLSKDYGSRQGVIVEAREAK